MSKQVKLTRRRVLGILITIGIASAAVGAGTFAAFSDTEQTTDNSVEAGSLDLTIDGTNESIQLLDVSNAVPGDRGENSTTLENIGSVNGTFNVTLSNMTNEENSLLDPEEDAGDREGNGGELASEIYVNMTVEDREWENQTLADLNSSSGPIFTDVPLNSSDSNELTLVYYIPEDAGNDIQTDSVTADFNVTLSS